jgi:calcineurin-like phosphoesterase
MRKQRAKKSHSVITPMEEHLLCGTHTHFQTADIRVLAEGCGYITDLGMTGPLDGVIGVDREIVIKRFKTQRHGKFEVAKGQTQINGALFEIDETFRCRSVSRVYRTFEA